MGLELNCKAVHLKCPVSLNKTNGSTRNLLSSGQSDRGLQLKIWSYLCRPWSRRVHHKSAENDRPQCSSFARCITIGKGEIFPGKYSLRQRRKFNCFSACLKVFVEQSLGKSFCHGNNASEPISVLKKRLRLETAFIIRVLLNDSSFLLSREIL